MTVAKGEVRLETLSAVPVAADTWDDATATYERGDYETAERLLRPLAEQGYAKAQTTLGVMYDNGQTDARSRGFAALETNGRYQSGGESSDRASERQVWAGSGHHAYCGQGPFCPLCCRLSQVQRTSASSPNYPMLRRVRTAAMWDNPDAR
jgi:hypothetical protein